MPDISVCTRAVAIYAELKNLEQLLDRAHTHGKAVHALAELKQMLAETLAEADAILGE